ncbi:MAG: hypothetical protein Q4F49_08135 [Pseudoxanthomonas suwonensis]|nr:hypothetical protein [Pseudoxanthomonas suwonensis]
MDSSKVNERLQFFSQWLKNPRQTASVTPSSPELAAALVKELPQDCHRIIELGGGTGAITRTLVQLIQAPDLLVVELNTELHRRLQADFPESVVLREDAACLPDAAERSGWLGGGPADAVVSGLGLLAMDRDSQRAILGAAFSCLAPTGRFIQFTYGPMSPVSGELLAELRLSARRGELVLRNVPPATVWVITRSRATEIRPRTVRQ